MTRDEIIRMAREAGFYFHDAGYAPILHTVAGEYSEACFERFATLVAAAEREACAKVCDEETLIRTKAGQSHPEESDSRGRCFAAARAAINCASAIRARSAP